MVHRTHSVKVGESTHRGLFACFVGLVLVTFLSSCTDSTSDGQKNLAPVWSIEVDRALMLVNAEASANTEQSTRLTNGDVLRLAWAGRYWQLYRRDIDFVYRRTFALPVSSNQFEARLDRGNPGFDSVVHSLSLPDISTATLVEEDMVVSAADTLNLSWEVDTATVSLLGQSVSVRQLDCNGVSSADAGSDFTVGISVRTYSVTVQNLPQFATLSAGTQCRYSLQLNLETSSSDTPIDDNILSAESTVNLTTRSRLFTALVETAGVAQ